jgi:hypothetical protein
MKGRYLIVLAVLAFLLFLGLNGYQTLCTPRWAVECVVSDGAKEEVSAKSPINFMAPTEDVAKELAAEYRNFGRTCTVTPVRECPWDTSSRGRF